MASILTIVAALALALPPAGAAAAADPLVSQGKAVTASSVEAAGLEPGKAVDGSTATRWASAEGVDPQWIRVDLGSAHTLSRVRLTWEAAYATAYRVQTSPDGSAWTDVYSTTTGDGGVDDLTISGSGRYVRVHGTQRGTPYGYSLWELEVYGAPTGSGGGTPVQANGQLRVCGLKLCNENGKQIQLRGMSSHGIQWYYQCLNTASLDALANDWKADVLRISMYIQEDGYETNPRLFTDRVHSLIEMATARGMYAIVDWHMLTPGDPMDNLDRAKTFFTEIAQRHNGKKNVLYEIANEPNGDAVTWSRIRDYAHQLIPVIRQYDPDAPVLVGTRAWSSLGVSGGGDESEIVNNPVNAANIMYTFHFYAGSHGTEYLNTLSRAADRLPIFVTEFGTQSASGDGANNFTRSQQYLDLMAQKKISWVNWNFSDDFRTGAVFKTGTCPNGSFAGTANLKEAGVWVRDRIRTADDF
ncbi:cellulase family glycosylhydrolase [Nonomuraea sp. FMUSA5-5]|uniref:cellulase n=1 Tax=Nonomuraea composti TaxID=2720023 RepID=A0ABX1BCQ0_9ACTN|nr:cellulase family glycosylhydrolase [Nonomuraea sp. FMUSA5-5]NJP92913.1 cellulase family glycosylhydrolase [Nonomuraea sp. FMUSA5-5]